METKYHLIDLKGEYRLFKSEIDAAVQRVLDSQHFILGPEVENFETLLADYCGTKYAVGVSSGTDALLATLMAIGIGRGDEVIVPAYSFVSTASCVARLGAKPVFVDIDRLTFNINTDLIERAITQRTKAIIPVHFAGQTADMDEINKIAKVHRLYVIEDACQALGAEYKHRRAGSLGDMGCFSFFPTKNLGGYGDSGAITTNNDRLYEKLRMIRNHGQKTKYFSPILGGNFRMDEIQAAILSTKLKYLDKWISWRRFNAKVYCEELVDVMVWGPVELPYNLHAYHLYIISSTERDRLVAYLKDNGVETGIYYPLPLYRQACFGNSLRPTKVVADLSATRNLALPIHPLLTNGGITEISRLIREFR